MRIIRNRLGMAILDGHSLGNPITLGLPVALVVYLGLLMDQGFWFGLKSYLASVAWF